MTEFVKYMHLERFGTNEVDGIEYGMTYVFPKLDGTNAQAWLNEDGTIGCGSRNRTLSIENDNAGFMNWAVEDSALSSYLTSNPNHTLYGEWLVPHSLKTYRDDAWRRFYVFDVYDHSSGAFIHYENYREKLAAHCIDFLPPIAQVRNGSYEKYEKCLEKATFGIKDGEGFGEGIVIKNYEWQNKYGRVTWAKLIANHFKEKHHAAMGAPEIGGMVIEEKICDEFVTQHLVDKVHAKIINEKGDWSSKYIGMLLGVVWHDLITEEILEIIKKHKNPKIDFSTLNSFCIMRIKALKSELF
jgi:hypothetical protein